MDDRIHRILDGDEQGGSLSWSERRELDAYLSAIEGATVGLSSPKVPDLTASVMDAIAEIEARREQRPAPGSSFRYLVDWLFAPRLVEIAWRPAYGLSLAMVFLAGGLLWNHPPPGLPGATSDPAIVPEDQRPPIFVQFRLEAPGATSVAVMGSFTNWAEGVELIETLPGVWSALLPLTPGVHDYTFVVDGDTWVVDPEAPAIDDGFGGSKNRLFLTLPLENA